jgi:hypothetical protein
LPGFTLSRRAPRRIDPCRTGRLRDSDSRPFEDQRATFSSIRDAAAVSGIDLRKTLTDLDAPRQSPSELPEAARVNPVVALHCE